MRLATSLTILCVCILLCSVQGASAQSPPQAAVDRPTQRWLPLPRGDGVDLNEQAQLLQQLRDLMSSESKTGTGDSPLPKLSAKQLREMEDAFENLRKQIGDVKLPDLENIPKEWIDQALSDPILRKQAQQLLEQYARDRKLPLASDRTPLNSGGVPFPRRQTSDKSQLRSGESPSAEEIRQSPEGALPSRPDTERVEALQELFKKLKTIEGQPQSEKNSPKNRSANTSSRNPSQGNSNSGTNNQAQRPNVPRGQPNSGTLRSPRNNSPRPATPLPEQTPIETLPSRPSIESPSGESSNDPTRFEPTPFTPDSENSNSARSDLGKPAPSRSNVAEPRSKSSVRRTAQESPPLESDSRSQQPESPGARPNGNGPSASSRTPNAWPASPKDDNQSLEGPNKSLAPEVDIKTQLERHGLGRALKSIVEKTLKEQSDSNAANERAINKNSKAGSKTSDRPSAKQATATVAQSSKPKANQPPPQNSNNNALNKVAQRPSAPAQSNPNPNTSSTMSDIRKMAAEIWGAIRSTPGEDSGGLAASAPATTGGGLGEFEFAWNGQLSLLLALVGFGIVILVLLARKRVEIAKAAREADAEIAKEILSEGITTRADVVRAFHRFVLRRAQPVANWWNHRYVASRLTETSPQLRSVISDLANVYEHARYLPPEVALTADEIDRVQAALKQCAACSV